MLKGIFIGIGVAFGLLIGMVGCTALLLSAGANTVNEFSTKLEEAADPEGKTSAISSPSADNSQTNTLELRVDSMKRGPFGTVDAIVRVKNNSRRDYSMIFVDCAFLGSDDQAVDSGVAMITNLGSSQTGYGEATAMDNDAIKSVSCRVSETM